MGFGHVYGHHVLYVHVLGCCLCVSEGHSTTDCG